MGLYPLRAESACIQCHSQKKAGEIIGYVALEKWAEEDFKQLAANRWNTLLAGVALVILLSLALMFIIRRIVRPLKKMAGAASQMAVGESGPDN